MHVYVARSGVSGVGSHLFVSLLVSSTVVVMHGGGIHFPDLGGREHLLASTYLPPILPKLSQNSASTSCKSDMPNAQQVATMVATMLARSSLSVPRLTAFRWLAGR
jgi:hypothetical protein